MRAEIRNFDQDLILDEQRRLWAEQDRDRAGEEWTLTEAELDAMAATYWHEERDPLEETR